MPKWAAADEHWEVMMTYVNYWFMKIISSNQEKATVSNLCMTDFRLLCTMIRSRFYRRCFAVLSLLCPMLLSSALGAVERRVSVFQQL